MTFFREPPVRDRLAALAGRVTALGLRVQASPQLLEPPHALGTLAELERLRADLVRIRDELSAPQKG